MSSESHFTLALAPTQPVEEVFGNFDLRSALALTGTCSRFYPIYCRNQKRLLRMHAMNEECLRGFAGCDFVDQAISV
jgi:hypothetical protein